ncbi:MAG: type II toxin-antitoxin system VapC family toxin, partial [Verrucomicrobiia bacterium]
QVLVWHRMEPERLSPRVVQILESPDTDLYVSLVAFWELALKESNGKLEIPGGVDGIHADWLSIADGPPLALDWRHIERVKQLPCIHRDPFDRMLVAQALVEKMAIITNDPNIAKYPGVHAVW